MSRSANEEIGTDPRLEPRDQIAALPVRLKEDGTIEVLLVTSRETRRWIIPKGWPMDGLADHEAAGVEAHEEAGVKGRILSRPIGRYAYWQRARLHMRFNQVDIFLMRVDKVLKTWKEKGQRERSWFSVMEAADLVLEPQLGQIFLRLPGLAEAREFLDLDGQAKKAKSRKPRDRKGDDPSLP